MPLELTPPAPSPNLTARRSSSVISGGRSCCLSWSNQVTDWAWAAKADSNAAANASEWMRRWAVMRSSKSTAGEQLLEDGVAARGDELEVAGGLPAVAAVGRLAAARAVDGLGVSHTQQQPLVAGA